MYNMIISKNANQVIYAKCQSCGREIVKTGDRIWFHNFNQSVFDLDCCFNLVEPSEKEFYAISDLEK